MALPILSVARMRAWESATWAAGTRGSGVIERVGLSLAAALRRWCRRGDRVLLLAGKGHNGDDVRAAIPHLPGFALECIDVADPAESWAPIAAALERRPDWIVDGLFGIGLNRPLSDAWRALFAGVNASGRRVLAMDVPSGLDADTGDDWGSVIRADVTLTVGAPKRGLLAPAAVRAVGRLEIATDVGLIHPIPEIRGQMANEWWSEADDFDGFPGRRRVDAHKGDFGHVAILAGSVGWHGAAVLAARGALRARPGLVTVLTSPGAYVPVASQLASAMVRPWERGGSLPSKTTALVVGPGLAHPAAGPAMRDAVRGWWREFPGPMVADASALDWLEHGVVARAGPRVVTPHPGEAARLLGTDTGAIQRDRPAALHSVSERLGGCWVVLKGHHTLVGRAGEPPWWNGTGNAGMAQGGTGDVLAGYIGGLLAQAECARDPSRTIRAAVWRHGASADALENLGRPWDSEALAGMIGP